MKPDVELLDHLADRVRLGVPSLDVEVESTSAADRPDPVRRARCLLHGVAVGEEDVPVLGVLRRGCPYELVNVASDVCVGKSAGVVDVADLALALLVGDDVSPYDLGPESDVVEHALDEG